MGRNRINYVEAYRSLKTEYESALQLNIALLEKHNKLIKEFDKAVSEGKLLKEMLYEQRGVIGFLEDKIEKLRNGTKL